MLAAAGWIAALGALLAAACLRASLDRRMSLVAQAAHELRGPLSAALLGLHGVGAGSAAARRLAAVQLELRRAGLALEDLHAAPHGRRAPELAEPVDVGALWRRPPRRGHRSRVRSAPSCWSRRRAAG